MAVALTVITPTVGQAGGDAPRGRRSARITPTHVIVDEVDCAVGTNQIRLLPGVAVAAPKRVGARGSARVNLAGRVDATCSVPVHALGKRVAEDTEIEAGDVYAGALVRVLPGKPVRGRVRVESFGDVRASFELPADALTVEPREFLYRSPPNRHFVTPYTDTTLYRKAASVGTNAAPVAVIAGGVEVVLLDQQGATARVRTHGPIEVEGWALNKEFRDKGAEQDARLLEPTHEVFVGVDLFATADASEPFARLRGGALVEIATVEGSRAKVTTTESVIAAGWVDARGLRELAAP